MPTFRISLHFKANERTFNEIFYNSTETTAFATLQKLIDPATYLPILAFRGAGTVLLSATSVDIKDPRSGDFILINKSAPPVGGGGAGEPDVVNTAALVRVTNTVGRVATRMIRGWRDDWTVTDEQGIPINTGPANAALDNYVTALNRAPAYGSLKISQTASGASFGVLNVTALSDTQTQLTLSPGDFTSLNVTTRADQFYLKGPRNRNLLGIKGSYYPASVPASPNIVIDYGIINAGTPPFTVKPGGLKIRKLIQGVVNFNKMTLIAWRSRKTADPIARARGRGRKVQTRE